MWNEIADPVTPRRLYELGYTNPSFLQHFNVMLGVTVIPIIIGIVLYIIYGITQKKFFKKWAIRCFKEYMVFTIMFSALNIVFSSCIHFKYSE